ncbi:MAG: DUF4231 domain-containing protein [Metamycoplasmataceae bacterium]
MNIGKFQIVNFGDNIDYFINLYKRKLIVLKMFITLTNIIFPTISLILVVISTLNLAGGEYETAIKGADYIILSAMISGIVALINSLISFFLLNDKIRYYNQIHYQLIIEKQRFSLNGEKYKDIENIDEKKIIYENYLFKIITGYEQKKENKKEK